MRKITKEEYKEYKYLWKGVTKAITVITIIDMILLLFIVVTCIFKSALRLFAVQLFTMNLVFPIRHYMLYYFVCMVSGMYIAHVGVEEKYINDIGYHIGYHHRYILGLCDKETGELLSITVDKDVYDMLREDI